MEKVGVRESDAVREFRELKFNFIFFCIFLKVVSI